MFHLFFYYYMPLNPYLLWVLLLMGGWHLHDSVARIGTNFVVPVRKLLVKWRQVCVNTSGVRAMSGREFWNVQNVGHDNFRDRVVQYAQTFREVILNSSGRWGRMRASTWQCAPCHDCHELPRILSEQLTSRSRVHRRNCAESSCQCGNCVNYEQTIREFVVQFRVMIGTYSWNMRELVVNSAGFVPQNGTTCHDKIVAKSRASVSPP